jgi:hypothetical protein
MKAASNQQRDRERSEPEKTAEIAEYAENAQRHQLALRSQRSLRFLLLSPNWMAFTPVGLQVPQPGRVMPLLESGEPSAERIDRDNDERPDGVDRRQ